MAVSATLAGDAWSKKTSIRETVIMLRNPQ